VTAIVEYAHGHQPQAFGDSSESDAIKAVRAVSSTKPTTVEGSIGLVLFVAWRTGFTRAAPRPMRPEDVDACEGRLPMSDPVAEITTPLYRSLDVLRGAERARAA
jgi:hypothetical protein